MAIHWQIPFKSFRTGTVYTINIYDSTYSASPIQLRGGSEPFVTEGNDDDDIFCPVRTQTGYLRIVDNGKDVNGNAFNWRDLMPTTDTDRPVTLTHTENGSTITDWKGFMQAQYFGGTLYGNPQEREFPIQCMLSVLGSVDINYDQKQIQNFAYLLKFMIDNIPTFSFEYIYLGGYIANAGDVRDFMLKKIDWQNFVKEDSDGVLSARYKLSQCLEDMCTFFGLTARAFGNDLYLMRTEKMAYLGELYKLTYNDLISLATGTSSGTSVYLEQADISSRDIFASTNNSEGYVRGAHKITITSDVNASNGKMCDTTSDGFKKICKDSGWGNKTVYDDGATRYTDDVLTLTLPFFTGSATSGKGSFNIGRLFNEDMSSFQDHEMIRMKALYNGNTYASIQTVYEHGFSNSRLSLKAKCFYRYKNLLPGNGIGVGKMVMRLGIGKTRATAQWLTYTDSGEVWGSTVSTIKMYICHNGDDLWILSSSQPGHSGVATNTIKAPSGATGLIFVDFLGAESEFPIDPSDLNSDTTETFDIADFRIEIGHNYGFDNDPDQPSYTEGLKERLEYIVTNNSRSDEELNSDVIYATDKNALYGYGLIMDQDGTFTSGINIGGTMTPFEQVLANRISAYKEQDRRKITCELRTNVDAQVISSGSAQNLPIGGSTPLRMIRIDGVNFAPLSISRQWRDDTIIFTLLELATS